MSRTLPLARPIPAGHGGIGSEKGGGVMRAGMRKATKTLADQLAGGVNALRDLAGDLADVVQSLSEGRPPRIDELTMPDVVGFFVDHKKTSPAAVAGVIIREREETRANQDQAAPQAEYLVHLFFLDNDGQPLIGDRHPRRAYLAGRLDDELARAFGTNNIVIFK
jgi:hypothetical protein